MKLTHDDLLLLGQRLDYPFPDGLCHGFACMWAQAVFAKKTQEFYERLYLIEKYKGNFKALTDRIEIIKALARRIQAAKDKGQEYSAYPSLTEEDKKLLDIVSFYEGMMLYLLPGNYADFFGGKFLTQYNVKKIYKITKPSLFVPNKIHKLFYKNYIFKMDSLKKYLEELKFILSMSDASLPILLGSPYHTVSLLYDRDKQGWIYVDANPAKNDDIATTSYERELNTDELAEAIFYSFKDVTTGYTVFNTTVLATNFDVTLKEKFDELDHAYPIEAEQATHFNIRHAGLLYMACRDGKLEEVKTLIKLNPKVDLMTMNGVTPLYCACQNGYASVVEELLKNGSDPNLVKIDDDMTPLIVACQFGHVSVADKLILKQAEVNAIANNNFTAIYAASQYGHTAVVDLLIKNKAVVDKPITASMAVLFEVAKNNNRDAAFKELLEEKSIRFTAQSLLPNFMPLHAAIIFGHEEVVESLIKANADIHAESKGISCLEMAVMMDNEKITKLIQTALHEQSASQNFKA